MRVGLLGSVRVVADGRESAVGGPRVRALLARLALAPGRTVTVQGLAEALWPEEGPRHTRPALQSLVSRLRRALPGDVLRSEADGYRLDLSPDAVDACRFERLADEGRRALRSGHTEAAAEHLTAALDLWRGTPLADLGAFPFAAAETERLAERRLGAEEDRFEVGLAVGADPGALVTALEPLTAAHPLRERLRGLLVRALAADGRRPEALASYESYRALLAGELGTDPGPGLRELHLSVLREDAARPVPPGNLRAPLTGFVDREDERRLVGERMADHRLVTLVGPGGVGKTRLATAAAPDLADHVWLVELAPVSDPADVPRAAARALGLRLSGDVVPRLVEVLSAVDAVLVLDGCEHVLSSAAHLAEDLLGRCPRLRVLATSREPLGITGEAPTPVRPLGPDSAVRLFTARARAVRPGFVPTDEVGQVCRRLDGLPLAIELAAVRLRTMPLDVLVERLGDRFGLLSGGSRTAAPRHRTLRGVIAWSWDLLTGPERAAAERLSVFLNGCTPRTAERAGIAEDLLYSLVDKSLLETDGSRLRMLDTIRAFGLERLAEDGTLHAARVAHAAALLDLAETAEPHLRGTGQAEWVGRLTTEHDDLLAALDFTVRTGDAGTAVRLGAALAQFWTVTGDHAAAARRLGDVLRSPGPAPTDAWWRAAAGYLFNAAFAGGLTDAATLLGTPPTGDGATAAFVRALHALAHGETGPAAAALEPHVDHSDPWTRAMLRAARYFVRSAEGAADRAADDLSVAVRGFRQAGERWGLSLTLMFQAFAHTVAGRTAQAAAALDEAEELTRLLGTHDDQRVWLAMVRVDLGDTDRARALLLDAVAAAPDAPQEVLARICLADLARHSGDADLAHEHLDRVGEGGDPAGRALRAVASAHLRCAEDEPDAAAELLAEAFDHAAGMPDPPMLAHVAVGAADLRYRTGAPREAAELLGAAHTLRGGPNPRNPDVAWLRRVLRGHDADYERGRSLDAGAARDRLRQACARAPASG
ncbi:ATP-binding protein [Nocardiopsis aegyptia]|uniref:ATP-binding protein n=1 Tax=Nocardiopsis aegyptia TaxID=220378 RepID=UPI00366B15B2